MGQLLNFRCLVPWYAVVVVFLAGLLGVVLIGVLQLRNDRKLKDKDFLTLLKEFFKSLPLLKLSRFPGEGPGRADSSTPQKKTRKANVSTSRSKGGKKSKS